MDKFWQSKQAAYGEALALLAIGGLAAYLSPAVGIPLFIILFILGGYLVWRSYKYNPNEAPDDGLILLRLLDEDYHRLKDITKDTILKLRKRDWQDLDSASMSLMALSGIDFEEAVERILLANVIKFMTGQKITAVQDAERLAKQIKESPLFTRNPEHIAKDASVILREKLPYLKKRMEHDSTYRRLERQIARERDKFPSEAVSKAVDEYLDHSIKINAAWVMSTHDLDNMPIIEHLAGQRLPMQFKVILMGLPGRMDEEMTRYRNKVAVAIFEHLKESKL